MDRILRRKGIQAALSSALFLGLAPIFGKQAILFGFSPLSVTATRTTLAAILIVIIMLLFQRRYFYIFPVGLIGCFLAGFINGLGSVLYYTALGRLEAGVGHILYSFYPIFIAIWHLLDRQTVTRITFLRLIISLPAVLFIVQRGDKFVDLTGAALMVGSSMLYALHLVINQRVLYEVPAPTVTLYTLIAMSLTVTAAFFGFDRQIPAVNLPWWPVLALAVITFFSRILLFLGVKRLGGVQTALLGLSELLVAVFLSYIWLGEKLSVNQWLGVALLVISLFLVGFDRFAPEKKRTGGWLRWLNPPQPNIPGFPGNSS